MSSQLSTRPNHQTKFAVIVLTGACLIVATVWGVTRFTGPAKAASTLPPEFSVESLKAKAEDPGAMMTTVREAMRRDDLTDEQRQELRQNMGQVWRETVQARVDEYFNAPPEEQTSVLDKHIDQLMAQMAEWEKRREEMERTREEDRQRVGQTFGQASQQERKERSEARNPDSMARAMAYFGAVRNRMSERGIKMPQGFGGRGLGGPGGGGGRRGP